MEPNSSLHQALLNRNKDIYKNVYLGSVLMVNKNIPLFEEYFGALDYDWVLKATANRPCSVVKPCVIRHVTGKNLSLDPEYRKKDFYTAMLLADGNIRAMRRICGTRARYYYQIGNGCLARFWFLRADFTWKSIFYFLTSFFPVLREQISKRFRVFG